MSLLAMGLGLHFILELCALAAMVFAGFRLGDSLWVRLLLGIALPVAAAAVWGIFRVPNDPGAATVAIPGPLRLLLEWTVFALAIGMLYLAGQPAWAMLFLAAVVIDYAIMHERVLRLLRVR
ncbi:MAG: YrdB family protein [Caldilineaceae bacterium]|nr:YrdB family protein [Caldilineaceae bacterium]